MPFGLAPLLILAICHVAWAGAWGTLSGKNALGELVVVTDDTRSLKPEIITSRTDGEDVSIPFEGACSFSLGNIIKPPRVFSCKPTGTSALAGTTYRQIGSSDACNKTTYACIAGCSSPKVPKTLVYAPWEC